MDPSSSSPNPDLAQELLAQELLVDNGIDHHWLSETLASTGGGHHIDSLQAELVGTGQVGENVRCRLRWSGSDAGPASVVIKLASANETSRAAAQATRTYIREVGFYRDLAPSVAIRVPRAHHVSEDREANRFILVMEDIAPAAAGDQLAGCSLDQAELAVTAAADLHGSTWGRQELANLDWLDGSTEENIGQRVELFATCYPAFLDRYRQRLSGQVTEFGQWLSGSFESWLRSRIDTPQSLVHGDFRLDNMLFGTGEQAPPLTTVDWQTPALGPPLSDVAYFLSGSLPADRLRSVEQQLLDRYRSRLADHGVELSEPDCWQQYRLAAPSGLVMAVIASQLVGRTDRGDDMFMVMAEGSASQGLAVDTAALV